MTPKELFGSIKEFKKIIRSLEYQVGWLKIYLRDQGYCPTCGEESIKTKAFEDHEEYSCSLCGYWASDH